MVSSQLRKVVSFQEITVDTKGGGIIHHTFEAVEGELAVIDVRETAANFQSFFEGNAKVAKVAEPIGVTDPPAVAIYDEAEAAGRI